VLLTNCSSLALTNTVVISNSVTIMAETNVIIAGNNLTRLFTVQAGGSLTLSNLTLQSGRSTTGGAIYIDQGGSVTSYNCIFQGNTAAGVIGLSGTPGDASDPNYGKPGGPALPGWPGLGGAICNRGNLEVYSCQFLTNSALGGSGGSGGNGAAGTYQGGNGGTGGNGNVGYGGAIYNSGTVDVTNCAFTGNTATGGNGGAGGTNGGGVFNGYAGNGGSGAYAGGGAICSGPGATIETSTFSGNAAQGGSSAAGGTAGGGYGVNGAPGGTAFGGAVCLIGSGALADSQFLTNSATGGNGGDGGNGNYGGGNGGDGGNGIGGCVYNFGKAAMVNCTFAGCLSVGGTNGAAGGGPFAGLSGRLGQAITNRLANGVGAFGTVGPVLSAPPPGSTFPTLVDPGTAQPTADTSVSTASSSPADTQSGPSVSSEGVSAKAAAATASTPASGVGPAGSNFVSGPNGALPGLPASRADRLAGTNNPAATPAAGLTNATPAQPRAKSPADEPLPEGMIDFRGADLNQVLDIYSMLVNRTLLRPATLPAPTVILKTQGQLTMKEGIQALEAVLALNGITMVNVGDKFVKVMAEAQAGSAAAPFGTNTAAQLPDLGQYVTHVVQLKYSKPSELVPVLTPFVKIPNAILPLDANQILVLRDYAENVKRMLEMVAKIDVAVPSEFVQEVIPIKYGKASDIAGALNSLSGSGGGGASIGGGSSSGSRTGSRSTTGRTGGTMGGGGSGGTGSTFGGGTGGSPFGQPGMNPQANTQQQGTGNNFTQRLQNIINRASSATGEIQILGQTKIISDERTNSLLIFASKEDMKTIKDIISKLDVVLAQVLIESAIISVTLTDSRDLGFSYLQHPQNVGSLTGVGALNNNTFQSPQNYLLNANGVTNASGAIPGGFTYLMSFGQDLDVALSAAASDTRAKILQTPRIQTSHNEPASIFVGESRPYPTSSYYGGGAYGGYSSIQQLEIGVSLDVTPLINPDGLVVMDIHQKIDSFEGNVTIENVGDVPITSEKEAQAKVSVRDHDTIILGGLVETDKNQNKSGVPFLMDLPMLGYLFRSSHVDESRQELIVLIRPTVLPTPEIAALTARAEKNKMPGVLATEREIRDEDAKRLKQVGREEPIPFQPVKP
jgi:general secretion pathway protein D